MSAIVSRQLLCRLLLVLGMLLLSAGIAAAAVSGSFTATYDGYNTQQTDARGHEIGVSGELEVTGDSVVQPQIYIKGADHTVLDTNSISVFVEGDRSLEFTRHYQAGQVVLTTDEIPTDTTIRIQFNTYFVGGTDTAQITAGQIDITYDTPSGASERKSYSPSVELQQSPDRVIKDLEQGNTLGQYQRIASYVGPAVALILLAILLLMRRDNSGGLA